MSSIIFPEAGHGAVLLGNSLPRKKWGGGGLAMDECKALTHVSHMQ